MRCRKEKCYIISSRRRVEKFIKNNDDGGVWAGDERSEETFANSAVGTGDEVGGFGHDEKIDVKKCGLE